MKVVCYADGDRSNFGDDLNRWLWRRLLGPFMDVQDGTVVLGIGTVISRSLIPPAERYVVLSSGVGYDALPLDFGGPKWEVLSVRGPLTATILNLPPEKAITDGAALLRLLPECEPLPGSERDGVLFMPHYEALPEGDWEHVCGMAGIEFLDPLADSEQTVQRIRRARLVIADAMHAAIAADALRVPWIPVVLSPRSNTFKWLDWTLGLDLPYRPVRLPASTLLESVRNRSLRFYGQGFFLEDRTPANAIEHYRRFMHHVSRTSWPSRRRRMIQITFSLPSKIVTSPVCKAFRRQQDRERTRRAAEQLRRVAEMPSYLSEERLFMSRLQQLADLLRRLQP